MDLFSNNKSKLCNYFALHIILLFYSFGGICSKLASGQEFMSFRFVLFYGLLLLDMMIYAFLWQQILKKIPLSTAYPNKAVGIVWGMLWGVLLFNETITLSNIIGGVIVLVGVFLVVNGNEK